MASYADLREGLRVRLAAIAGLNAYAYWPAMVDSPAAVVDWVSRTPHIRSGNGSLTRWRITLLAGPAAGGDSDGQAARDEYLAATGAKSIQAALEADTTLGGAINGSLVVQPVDNGPVLEWPAGSGMQWWGGHVDLELRD